MKKQFELFKQYNHQIYEAKNGVHGSSMLVESRVHNDVTQNWNVVNTFLMKFKE